jgi:Fe-S-cluster-containing dehydrogenase component/CRP-like cAMP-binding protein
MTASTTIERPNRWDHPFDLTMRDRDLEWILSLEPFSSMDPDRFSNASPLVDIIRNDARISRYETGDVIVREGDYGSSAFIVLRGSVRVIVTSLAMGQRNESKPKTVSFWKALRSSLKNYSVSEVRNIAQGKSDPPASLAATSIREVDDRPRIFLQDVDAVLKGCESEPLGPGEIFGELAAITRSSSNYTVVADGPVVLLEMRWQGLRLLRRDPNFQAQLDRRYREASLKTQLREMSLFRFIPPENLEKISEATQLRSYGDMEWFADYRDTKKLDVQEKIKAEPLIIQEGSPANWLVVIRSGFARRSYQHGQGHRTISYLGRGQIYGLQELLHNVEVGVHEDQLLPYQESLRGIGFVDALLIPRREFIEHAMPFIRTQERTAPIRQPRYDANGPVVEMVELKRNESNLDPALLEFLVDHRLMNGRQAMMIDTDLCTRCDDCVRACARTHEGNPRFIRSGPQFDRYQFTQACMHCVDPVCMIGCPTGAIARDTDSGVIAINPETCIGCKVCAESCPYNNIVMVEIHDARGRKLVDRESKLPVLQATKCDLCQSSPTGPACQLACPHEALVRIDLSKPSELHTWIRRKAA